MNNLSTEILINIFSHLHLVQKLECLLVCRQWAHILGAGYLLETTQNDARSIVQDVWYKPFSKPPKEDQFEGWKNNLQVFGCVFKRLSTLNIDPIYVGVNDYYYNQLFSHFGNLPALTNLTLRQFSARISQLEVLHNNAPGLTSFTLRGSSHLEHVDLQSLDIKPAEKLTSLHMKKVYKNPKQSDMFFEYIKLKYTHLSQLTHCEPKASSPDFERNERIETEWTQLLSTIGSGLKTCRITWARHTTAIPDLLAKHTTQLENLSDSWPFHSNVEPFRFENDDTIKGIDAGFVYTLISKINVTLNSITNDLPKSIKKLAMSHANFTVDSNVEELNQDSNITHLDMSQSVLDDTNISSFLTRHFKKLYSLVLARCVMGHPMYLPNHHLGYAELTPVMQYMGSSNRLMYLQLTVSGKTQYFRPLRHHIREGGLEKMDHKGHRPLQQVLKGSPSKDTTVDYFHFTCASVDTAYFRYLYLLL